MTTDEQRAWLARTLLHGAVLAGLLFCGYRCHPRRVLPLRGKVLAPAPARQGVPDYHAADARQSSGERKPVTA